MKVKAYGLIVLTILGACVLSPKNVQAQQVLWSRDLTNSRVDAGALLDISIPGIPNDVLVLGVNTIGTSTTVGGTMTVANQVVGLDSRTGNIAYIKVLGAGWGYPLDYIISMQSLPDRSLDQVEEVLVRAKMLPANSTQIINFVLNGITGDVIGTPIFEYSNYPIVKDNEFLPIKGDFDGNGNKDNAVIRQVNFNPNVSSGTLSRMVAIR